MATRGEIQQRRQEMASALREDFRAGRLAAGQAAPSLRELSGRFGVSQRVVMEVMGQLIEERLFHTVPRVGTFVGPPRLSGSDERPTFAFVGNPITSIAARHDAVRQGFEDRIAHLGGAVLSVVPEAPLEGFAGVFEWVPARRTIGSVGERTLARVVYDEFAGTARRQTHGADAVAFDNVEGGRQAAQHLLADGHTRLAFVGLHGGSGESWPHWSSDREAGWREALHQARGRAHGVAFHAAHPIGTAPDEADEEVVVVRLAREGTRQLIAHLLDARAEEAVSGVVTANDRVAQVLIEGLRSAAVPLERWPAIVGFDGDLAVRDQLLSSLRLPWDELGRAAADLLWEHWASPTPLPVQHRLVRPRLIPRLTCFSNWSRSPHLAALAATP